MNTIQPQIAINLVDARQWTQHRMRVRLILESGRPYTNAPNAHELALLLIDGRVVNRYELAWTPKDIDSSPIPPPAAIVAEQYQHVHADDRLPGDPAGWWRPVGARGLEVDTSMLFHKGIGYLKPGSRIILAARSFDFGTMEKPP